MKFDDLKFEPMPKEYGRSFKVESKHIDPIQAYVNLPNGLEVSVVQHGASHGHEKGLYEMGVFYAGGERMMEVEAWGDTVKGWLKPEHIEKELEHLETL
jgi:hypothetical protein